MPDFVDTMAYAGQVPWHGLGTELEADASTEEMLLAAFPRRDGKPGTWGITKTPLFYPDPLAAEGEEPRMLQAPNRYLLARDDDGSILSRDPVSNGFGVITNRDMLEFGDALHRAGEARWHTAGSLHDGRRVWALAQVPGQYEVRGEILAPYLLLYDARDASSTFRCRFTWVRVVCANTAAMALHGHTPAEVAIRHSGDVGTKLDRAREVLGLAEKSFVEQARIGAELAGARMTEEEMRGFACQILTGLDDLHEAMQKVGEAEGRSRTTLERRGGELMKLFSHGNGNRGESAWDAFNAVTDYIDHQRARAGNWRRTNNRLTEAGLESGWFGQGERTKKRALRLLASR